MDPRPLKILYTNYRGETSIRNVIPEEIYFGSTEWHSGEQWLLKAMDLDKGASRTFAMEDIDFIYGAKSKEKVNKIVKFIGEEAD